MFNLPKVKRGRPRKETSSQPIEEAPDMSQPEQEQSLNQSSPQTASTGSSVSKPRGRGAAQKGEIERIRGALTLAFSGVAGIISLRDPIDGAIFKRGAVDGIPDAGLLSLVDALCQLAEQDKSVRAYLLSMTVNSAYMNVIGSLVIGILIPILAHHDMLPALMGGRQQEAPKSNGVHDTDNAYPSMG